MQNPDRQQAQPPYQSWQQPYVHKFPQNNASGPAHPAQVNNPSAAPEDKPQKGRRRKAKKEKQGKQRGTSVKLSVTWFILGLIGLGTVLVQLARYVIIPLLVQLYDATGGA